MTRIDPAPPVSCRYGAPLGRFTCPDYLDTTNRLNLIRVPINRDGYDRGGAYWGLGNPLWYTCDDCGNSRYFRARDRDAAKAALRSDFPEARFYR